MALKEGRTVIMKSAMKRREAGGGEGSRKGRKAVGRGRDLRERRLTQTLD